MIRALRCVVVLAGDVLPGFEDAPLMTARLTIKRAIRVPGLNDVLDPNQTGRRAPGAGGLVGHGPHGIPSEVTKRCQHPPSPGDGITERASGSADTTCHVHIARDVTTAISAWLEQAARDSVHAGA